MITRLREKYSDQELRQIYATPHQHDNWLDHRVRVQVTLGVAKFYENIRSVADLSCGDGWIIDRLDAPRKYKGDFAAGYQFRGPIERTLNEIPPVDLFILSETIEHVDDPEMILAMIRKKTRHLVLSTPIGETDPACNPQHYWGWDDDGMRSLLEAAGFRPDIYNGLTFVDYVYDFQIWGCS